MSEAKLMLSWKGCRIMTVNPDKSNKEHTFLKINIRIGDGFFNHRSERELVSLPVFDKCRRINKKPYRDGEIHTWILVSHIKPIQFAKRHLPEELKWSYKRYLILNYPYGNGEIEQWEEGGGDCFYEAIKQPTEEVRQFLATQLSLGRGRDWFPYLQENREFLQHLGFKESKEVYGLWSKGGFSFDLKDFYYKRISGAIGLISLRGEDLKLTLDSAI